MTCPKSEKKGPVELDTLTPNWHLNASVKPVPLSFNSYIFIAICL